MDSDSLRRDRLEMDVAQLTDEKNRVLMRGSLEGNGRMGAHCKGFQPA